MKSFLKKIKKILIILLTILVGLWVFSWPETHFMLVKLYLYNIDGSYKSLVAKAVKGTVFNGYTFEKVVYCRASGETIAADRLYFSPLVDANLKKINKISLSVDTLIYNFSSDTKPEKIDGKSLVFKWPSNLSEFNVKNIIFHKKSQLKNFYVSPKGCAFEKFQFSNYIISDFNIDFKWKSHEKSKGDIKGLNGSFFFNEKKIDLCINREKDDYLCELRTADLLPGGVKLDLVWITSSNQLKSRVRLKAKSFVNLLKDEVFKNSSPFELYGDITCETFLNSTVFAMAVSGDYSFKEVFGETLNTFYLSGNSLAVGKDKKRKVFKKLTGIIEMHGDNASFEDMTFNHEGYPFRAKGTCSGDKVIIHAISSEFSLTKKSISKKGIKLSDYFDLDICGNLGINLDFNIKKKGSLVSKYRYTSEKGSLVLLEREFGLTSLEATGDGKRTIFSAKLKWRRDLINLDGQVTKDGVEISFSSNGLSIYHLKGFDFEKPVAVKGRVKVRSGGYSVFADVTLNDNSIIFLKNRFTNVNGTVRITDKGLDSKLITGTLGKSELEAEKVSFNFSTGDYSLALTSFSATAEDITDFLKTAFPESKNVCGTLKILGKIGLKQDIVCQNKKKKISGYINFHKNPLRSSIDKMDHLFKKIDLSMSGKLFLNSKKGDFSKIVLSGLDPSDPGAKRFSGKINFLDDNYRSLMVKIDNPPVQGILNVLGVKLPLFRISGEKAQLNHILGSSQLDLKMKKITYKVTENGLKGRITDSISEIDVKKGELNFLKGHFFKGKVTILNANKQGVGLFSVSEFDLGNFFKYNNYFECVSGKASASTSLVKSQNSYRGPYKFMLFKKSIIKNFIPQKIENDFFKTPFLDPLEINWLSLSGRIDTSSKWFLSTYDEDSFLKEYDEMKIKKSEIHAFRGMAPMYLKLDTHKVKLAGNVRFSKDNNLEAEFVAQFPRSVSQYINLGPYRTFFTRIGKGFVQFRNKPERVVYLPFNVSGKIDSPTINFDPEKLIFKKMSNNPLKLFNFIIPNIF